MNVRHIIHNVMLSASAAWVFGSCSMMTADLEGCPTGLYVNFVYDYNIQHADMLKDHVGGLVLCVYDESDVLVARRQMTAGELSRYGSYLHFSESELAPGHQYRLVAVALQKDWASALQTPGAKYRLTGDGVGTPWQQLKIDLDHRQSGGAGARALTPMRSAADYYPVSNAAPLDTLWHTLTTIATPAAVHPVEYRPASLTPAATAYSWQRDGSVATNGQERVTLVSGEPAYATVSLIRDTKHLNVTLRALNDEAGDSQVSADDYTVEIIDNNAQLDCRNNLSNAADTLVYTPYRQWTTTFSGGGAVSAESAAHYDLMFNRLVYKNASVTDDQYAILNEADIRKSRNAVLLIRKRDSGEIVFGINLPYILASGRTYQERYYHYQEYLDREYDYRLQFIIRGSRVDEIQMFIGTHVHIVSWAVRRQNESI